jgi:hypothetical protein
VKPLEVNKRKREKVITRITITIEKNCKVKIIEEKY